MDEKWFKLRDKVLEFTGTKKLELTDEDLELLTPTREVLDDYMIRQHAKRCKSEIAHYDDKNNSDTNNKILDAHFAKCDLITGLLKEIRTYVLKKDFPSSYLDVIKLVDFYRGITTGDGQYYRT